MGQLGVLIVFEVSATNVKRNREKEQNEQLPSRSDCFVVKNSFSPHSMLCMAALTSWRVNTIFETADQPPVADIERRVGP